MLLFFSFSDKWSWWSRLRFHQRPRTCSPFSSFFLFLSFFSLILFFLHVGRIVLIVLFSRFLIRKSVCISASVSVCTLWMSSNPVGYIPDSLFFVFLFFHVTHTCIHPSSFWCDFAWQFVSLNIIRKKVMRSLFPRPEWSGQNFFYAFMSSSLSLLFPHERVSHILIRLYCVVTGSITLRLWRTGEREQERTDEGSGWASKKANAIVVHN